MFRSLLVLAAMSMPARADSPYFHAELDPLTFANEGYGAQLGVRPGNHP